MNERNSKDNYHAAQMMTNEILIFKSLPQVRFWLIEYPNSNLDDSLGGKKQTNVKKINPKINICLGFYLQFMCGQFSTGLLSHL